MMEKNNITKICDVLYDEGFGGLAEWLEGLVTELQKRLPSEQEYKEAKQLMDFDVQERYEILDWVLSLIEQKEKQTWVYLCKNCVHSCKAENGLGECNKFEPNYLEKTEKELKKIKNDLKEILKKKEKPK